MDYYSETVISRITTLQLNDDNFICAHFDLDSLSGASSEEEEYHSCASCQDDKVTTVEPVVVPDALVVDVEVEADVGFDADDGGDDGGAPVVVDDVEMAPADPVLVIPGFPANVPVYPRLSVLGWRSDQRQNTTPRSRMQEFLRSIPDPRLQRPRGRMSDAEYLALERQEVALICQ